MFDGVIRAQIDPVLNRLSHMIAGRGVKSLFFTTGLAEASETIAVFVLACLIPSWFPALAWGYALICLYTAIVRIILACKSLS